MPDIATAPKLGRRTLTISGDLLCQMFKAGTHPAYTVVREAVPADARVVNARWDGQNEHLVLYVVSTEFASDHVTDYDRDISPRMEAV